MNHVKRNVARILRARMESHLTIVVQVTTRWQERQPPWLAALWAPGFNPPHRAQQGGAPERTDRNRFPSTMATTKMTWLGRLTIGYPTTKPRLNTSMPSAANTPSGIYPILSSIRLLVGLSADEDVGTVPQVSMDRSTAPARIESKVKVSTVIQKDVFAPVGAAARRKNRPSASGQAQA